jgi:hypothetical protein
VLNKPICGCSRATTAGTAIITAIAITPATQLEINPDSLERVTKSAWAAIRPFALSRWKQADDAYLVSLDWGNQIDNVEQSPANAPDTAGSQNSLVYRSSPI